MKKHLQPIDHLARDLAQEHPDHNVREVEAAVHLAVLKLGGVHDRERIRSMTRQLLNDVGVGSACATVDDYVAWSASRTPADELEPGSRVPGG